MNPYNNNEEMFAEQTVYRSVASRFDHAEEEQLDFEFGSGKDFALSTPPLLIPVNTGVANTVLGYPSSDAVGFGKSSAAAPSSSSSSSSSTSSAYYAATSTTSSSPSKARPLSLSVASRAPGYQIVQPPKLFDSYYDRCYSFESRASPVEILNVLQAVMEGLGCECNPLPSEAKIQVTQFVEYTHITCDANLFSKGTDSDLLLVEINRLRGDCMKFHTFYTQLVSALCEHHASLFSESQSLHDDDAHAPSVPSPSSSRASPRSTEEEEERESTQQLDASAVPHRPNLRRSPSSNGGLRELPLTPHDPHPFGPTQLSRDLLTSLIAFCRSKCFEQQREGLELLARLGAEPSNKGALASYAREILGTVALLLPSRDCGVQHSACALIAHVLNALRCDMQSLFAQAHSQNSSNSSNDAGTTSASSPSPHSHSRSSSSDSAADLDPKSMFSNVSSLLFGKSRHVRDAASNVLGRVATESNNPELVKSPLYLNWLRQDGGVRARNILRRLGSH